MAALIGVCVAVLATASTVGVAAATGALGHHESSSRACSVPALAGSPVNVDLMDMRSMMRNGAMMDRGPRMQQRYWSSFRHGMMRIVTSPGTVGHGAVSLVAHNLGYLTHELVVLPLAAGHNVGTREPGADGRVDETGSLGEASATCAPGAGDGIAGASAGWVTLHLAAGRYELICNLPGHYSAGMYTELDVT